MHGYVLQQTDAKHIPLGALHRVLSIKKLIGIGIMYKREPAAKSTGSNTHKLIRVLKRLRSNNHGRAEKSKCTLEP